MRASRAAVFGAVGPLLLGTVALSACGRGGPPRSPEGGTLRTTGVGANVDPTVRGARLLPEVVDESTSYGSESGGGTRVITSGLRVVTARDGAIVAADDRLPQAPMITTALPERLGGGFLFVLGSVVWRADHWLDTARPIFTSLQPVQGIVAGLDRIYLRTQSAYLAIEGKTGKVLDLGPWPQSPFVSSYAAADGWRAAAVTDLRGVVATFDAGATWRALDLPMEPRQVLASGDALAVGGIESGKSEAWFEIRGDGSIARMGGAPREAKGKMMPTLVRPGMLPGGFPGGFVAPPPHMFAPPSPVPTPRTAATTNDRDRDRDRDLDDTNDRESSGARIFGKRPLVAAIEDGWPLTDGTALVARDGALGRVRLADGALVELAQGAFPLKPARCHPVSLNRANALGAFGFVCGESRGPTAIYAFDPMRARLVELKRFDRPRVVTSSGNGAIAVRGPCAEDADPSSPPREPARIVPKETDAGAGKTAFGDGGLDRFAKDKSGKDKGAKEKDAKEKDADKDAKEIVEAPKPTAPEMHPFCILGHDNTWREVHVRGDVGAERVVVLTDGKIAVISPPQGQNAVARLTLLDKGKATTVPVAFPKVAADVARVLRLGIWLDGFEERKPGVVGGWVEAGGSMLGIEIGLDGQAVIGQYIRDAGMPFVSGRYGLGWNASKRGFETTDGGMTWVGIDVPEPLVPVTKVERRACGPIGCLAAGWLRVGWGEAKKPAPTQAPPPHRSTVIVSAPSLTLQCEPTDAPMPAPPAPKPKVAIAQPSQPQPSVRRPGFGGPSVLASPTVPGVSDLPSFLSHAGPTLRDTERGMPFEVIEMPDRGARLGALARIYTWGPKTGDWDTQGKWQVRWLTPFGGWPDARASLAVLPPQILVDFSRAGSGYGFGYGSYYGSQGFSQLTPGDDASHALLLVTRNSRTDIAPFELEADRAPVEIHRIDGEPFVQIEAAVRAAGRWFIVTPGVTSTNAPLTTVWQVDGSVARELVRIPRASLDTNRPTGTRLARRSDGRAIGLVVDGQATAERTTLTRWVLPIDLESGQLGEPEPLGYSDLGGRTLEACSDDIVGWVFDTGLNATTLRMRLPSSSGSMHSLYARVRLTSTRTCVERVAGMFDGQTADRAAALARAGGRVAPTSASASTGASTARSGEIIATAYGNQSRFALRCTVAK